MNERLDTSAQSIQLRADGFFRKGLADTRGVFEQFPARKANAVMAVNECHIEMHFFAIRQVSEGIAGPVNAIFESSVSNLEDALPLDLMPTGGSEERGEIQVTIPHAELVHGSTIDLLRISDEAMNRLDFHS